MALFAVDPGSERCGVARFSNGRCNYATVFPKAEFLERFEAQLARGNVALVVCEEFRLYPWVAEAKSFDRLEEVETIGVIKWLCGKASVELVMQSARVMKIARGHLRSRRIELLAKQRDARSAELHGYYYVLKGAQRAEEG